MRKAVRQSQGWPHDPVVSQRARVASALPEGVAEVLPEREEVCDTCVRPSVEPEFRFQRWRSRHFRSGLMLTRHLADRHVSVSTEAVTVRRPGRPTEHRPLRDGELSDLVRELGVPLTRDEESRLLEVVDGLRSAGRPRA